MSIDKYIEYVGYEDNFFEFLEQLDDKLKNEGRTVKIWCNLEFLPKIKRNRRIIPIYYKKYPCSVTSIKESIKAGKLFEVFCEVIRRLKHRNYIKYFKCGKENKVPCCLINCNGNLELVEDVKSEDFKGMSNTIVLRRYSTENGMFSHLITMLPYLIWAENNNLNVYFDMSRGDSTYREKKGENVWEYFYKQTGYKPCSHNGTIISELFELPDAYKITFEPKHINKIMGINNLYEKFIRLNDEMSDIISRNWEKISGGKRGKILGVKFRGTDYIPGKIPSKHHFQATCDEMLERTKKFLHKYNYKYVYLCTEEQKSLEKFKEVFGEKVLSYNCQLIENYESGGALRNQIELVGKRKGGEDYIGSVMCLAKCDSILCSLNSGAYMAFVINGGKFEYVEIVDKGMSN